MKPTIRPLAPLLAALAVAGCGVADTATSAAIGANAKAKEIEQAKAIQQQITRDLQQAQQQSDQRLREAESK